MRGHVFGELGLVSHAIERRISRTATGDHTGPFVATSTTEGRITSLWMGPTYRFVDRERLAVGVIGAPMLQFLTGETFGEASTEDNAARSRVKLGLLIGLRARYWLSDRLGVQLTVDDAMWTYPLLQHGSEGTELFPEAHQRTPRQHDLRVQLGVAMPLR